MKIKLSCLACIPLLLIACQNLQGQIHFGVKGGADIFTQSELGQLWDGDKTCGGFIIGGVVNYPLNSHLSLQTEVNYMRKGEKHTNTVLGEDIESNTKLNYLTVPLLLKDTFNDELQLEGGWNIFGFTGPYYGRLLSAKQKTTVAGVTVDNDITDDSVKDDWGIVFGGGCSYRLKAGESIYSELRYDMGLSEIDNDNSDLRNKAICLCLGFTF